MGTTSRHFGWGYPAPGRWKSEIYKRYIGVHPEHILGVSRRLQTFFPSSGLPWPAMSPPMAPLGISDTGAPASLGPMGGMLVCGGVRVGARECPGRPLGWQPQPLGPRTVPGLVAAPPPLRRHLGLSAAPLRGHSRE